MNIDASNPLAEEGAEMGLVTGDQHLATGGDGGEQDRLVFVWQWQLAFAAQVLRIFLRTAPNSASPRSSSRTRASV